MVSVSVLPKPKSFGFYRNPLWTETKTETRILGNFCPFLLIWKLNWALGDINSSKIMCCWKAIFVWKQCWCHYETCKSCWNFSISYTYIYFVYTYLLFSTKVHTIQRWIYFRKILLIFEFSRVSKPFFTEQFLKCQRNLSR